jgi:hypothetical protein
MDILRGMASRRAISAWAAARLGTRDHRHGMTAVGEIKKKSSLSAASLQGGAVVFEFVGLCSSSSSSSSSIYHEPLVLPRTAEPRGGFFVCLFVAFFSPLLLSTVSCFIRINHLQDKRRKKDAR